MSSTAFICITCQVPFADADLQRNHFKTDWHKYNLKRKVANLPPVTAEGFNQRVLAQRAQVASEASKETSFYCQTCGKTISSEAAYQNRVTSAKHREKVVRFEEPKEREEIDVGSAVREDKSRESADKEDSSGSSLAATMDTGENVYTDDEWDEDMMGIEKCLFCRKVSESLTLNVKHMRGEHSFYIPDIEFLIDLKGLIAYLGKKVRQGKICLWCNDRSKVFRSVKATQRHMIDKGHCMLLFEGETLVEYADFYDYSYSDGEMAVPHSKVDADVLEADDEYQLTLPSGAKVGHRSLSRYYKQNLVSSAHPEGKSVPKKVMDHHKGLDSTGAAGVLVKKRVKDLQYMQRNRQRDWQKLSVKANKTSRAHFRPQVRF